jgi:uncharacterized protein YjiS (DUF1127 family)
MPPITPETFPGSFPVPVWAVASIVALLFTLREVDRHKATAKLVAAMETVRQLTEVVRDQTAVVAKQTDAVKELRALTERLLDDLRRRP